MANVARPSLNGKICLVTGATGALGRAIAVTLAEAGATLVLAGRDDLQGERKFSALHAFGASKMANLVFSAELARRLAGTGVTANAVYPGLIRSNLMGELPFPMRWVLWLISSGPEKAGAAVADL